MLAAIESVLAFGDKIAIQPTRLIMPPNIYAICKRGADKRGWTVHEYVAAVQSAIMRRAAKNQRRRERHAATFRAQAN